MPGEKPALQAGEQEEDDIVIVSEKPATVSVDAQQTTKKPKISYQANLINMFSLQPSSSGVGTQGQGNSSVAHKSQRAKYFVGKRGKHALFDDLWVACILEKAKELGGARKAIIWFRRQFPRIQNFEHLSERSIQRWMDKGSYRRQKRGRKSIIPYIKSVVGKHTMKFAKQEVPMTLQNVHKHVIQSIRQDLDDYSILEEHNTGSNFKCSLAWFTKFVHKDLKLSLRAATTGRDLPEDWESLQRELQDRLAIRVGRFNIHKELVVNADQTGWHLAPHRGRSLARRGVKSVSIAQHGDKRQLTMMCACSAGGDMLPLQLVYKGKTDKVKGSREIINSYQKSHSWLFSTNADRHWANLDTMKEWVSKVLHPYFLRKMRDIKQHNQSLENNQKCILLLDAWRVHISKEFISWMRQKYPYILLLYIPARCTSKLQIVDLVVNYKLKSLAIQAFEDYIFQGIEKQLKENERRLEQGKNEKSIQIDFTMKTLRDKVPEFAYKGFEFFMSEDGKDLILKGWAAAGLDWSFGKEAPKEAMKRIEKNMDESMRAEWSALCFANGSNDDDVIRVPEEDIEQDEERIDSNFLNPDRGTDRLVIANNAMDADRLDDFGFWERFLDFCTKHIGNQSHVEELESQGMRKRQNVNKDTEEGNKQPSTKRRGRPPGSKNRKTLEKEKRIQGNLAIEICEDADADDGSLPVRTTVHPETDEDEDEFSEHSDRDCPNGDTSDED